MFYQINKPCDVDMHKQYEVTRSNCEYLCSVVFNDLDKYEITCKWSLLSF